MTSRSLPKRSALHWMIFVLLVASLACSLPGLTPSSGIEPASTAGSSTSLPPTATPPPPTLPPALVESNPAPGAELPLDSDVTLYFNQAMDQASVEAALSTGSTVGGKLTWVGETTLVFQPANALQPESDLVLAINQTAKARNGLAMLRPVEIHYRTAGFLRTAQLLPEPGAVDVDPSSVILLTFNRPVTPLGADPASLPAAFSLTPAAPGSGRWVNTSTYAFYPQPSMAGGQTYTVQINPDLRSTDGSPMQDIPGWSFSTALPRLVASAPADNAGGVALDASVRLEFNQPMNPDNTALAFRLLDSSGQAVAGVAGWNADFTTLVYTPTSLLRRSDVYTAQLDGSAQAAGGTALGSSYQAAWQTVGELVLYSHSLPVNGQLPLYNSISFDFSVPLPDSGFEDYVRLSPEASNMGFYVDPATNSMFVFANFEPATSYVLTIDPAFRDRWGGTLNTPYALPFTTGDLTPSLIYPNGGGTLFMRPEDSRFEVQSVNIFQTPAAFGSISLSDYLRIWTPNGYEFRNAYQAPDARFWNPTLNTQSNVAEVVSLDLSPDGGPLTPGLYWFSMNPEGSFGAQPVFMVVSNVQLTFKVSPSDVLVWAVDLRNQTPVPGVSVVIYAEDGAPLATGFTDGEGVFKSPIPLQKDPYGSYTAVLAQPGADAFSLAMSSWNQGIAPYAFDIPMDYRAPGDYIYLYSDRPIYRPGDTVYFRAVARQAANGRYSLPTDLPSLPVKIMDGQGSQVAVMDLPLSAYGTAHSEYKLFAGAAPGYYTIQIGDAMLSFQVADYRKPEINVEVGFAQSDVNYGQPLQAEINARYFFDAPASGVKVNWVLYAQPTPFYHPEYQVGPQDTSWLDAFSLPRGHSLLGIQLASGEAKTDINGLAGLELPTLTDSKLIDPLLRQKYTLEVTLSDESGLPISARSSAWVHPETFYIGATPDQWVGKAGQAGGFQIAALTFDGLPAGAHAIKAEYSQVTWERQDPPPGEQFGMPVMTPVYTPLGSVDFTTSSEGTARLEFTPPQGGVYMLRLRSGQAITEIFVWISGPGEAIWPQIPNQRLRLTADKAGYKPGETANVFIPNPFPRETIGLLTIERGAINRHQVVRIPAGGALTPVTLEEIDSPNVFAAVTLLGVSDSGQPDFRQGYLELVVDPISQVIQVELSVSPERAGPGDTVEITLQARNAAGQPVQGEFSLSVVDKAVLELADPNSVDIVPAFYGEQSLAVRTGLSLAAYIYRTSFQPGGLGGGGGDIAPPVARQDFPDTAFWEAVLLTDANGQAKVSLNLPDNLTTWRVEARGLTSDSLVGQALTEIITTKELIIRPAAPRFLVAGDHVQFSAVAQNNTQTDLPVTAGLQASGVKLDDGQAASQTVTIPAFGRARLEWWGTVEDTAFADLVFSARAGDLLDIVRLANGQVPVLHYAAEQAFATSGVLEDAGLQLELISMPASYPAEANPTDQLRLELAPSLAAAMIGSLGARSSGSMLCTEMVVSSFLPNLETYRLLQGLGVQATETQVSLESDIRTGLQDLLNNQKPDGGWGWWQENPSDSYMTAYALFALLHAQEAGMAVPAESISRAVDYLKAGLLFPDAIAENWQLDRLAFIHFTLASANAPDTNSLTGLYTDRARLSPWAQAFLALSFDLTAPGSQESLTLFSDLQAGAQRSALGASWDETSANMQNMHNGISTSAVVVYALAQHDPAAPLLTDAVRYLMANRRASRSWTTSFSASWALLAINSYIKGTGELNASFDFNASLNGESVLNGQAGGDTRLNPVRSVLPATRLYPGAPNALAIERGAGPGRLYYTAILEVSKPVIEAAEMSAGLSISRQYSQRECPQGVCQPLQQGQVGQPLTVHLNLTVPNDSYYVRLEDYIPAGAEILDLSLKTTQLGENGGSQTVDAQPFDLRRPFLRGWAWWLFSKPEIYADHIAWTASFLPAGSYEVTYTINLLYAGEFQVLPARAYQTYMPDIQGNSAGIIFTIQP